MILRYPLVMISLQVVNLSAGSCGIFLLKKADMYDFLSVWARGLKLWAFGSGFCVTSERGQAACLAGIIWCMNTDYSSYGRIYLPILHGH